MCDIKGMDNTTPPAKKRPGRPTLSPDERRSAKISVRTYPDVADKVARNGTPWLEAVVRRAKDKPQEEES